MDRLLNLQTALSLGYVGSMILAAHLLSLSTLPTTASRKTRGIFLWLVFDAICHLTLEASFLYLSVQNRTVNASSSFFGQLWQEYALADARWGTADATLVAMEWVTVLLAGPLAGYCAWLLARGDATYHYWVVVLCTGEIYGGWMTFAPEWLTGSEGLRTDDWLLLWGYLVVMNVVWVVVPIWLMVDSYGFVVESLRTSRVQDTTVVGRRGVEKVKGPTTTRSLTSTRGLSGSAYLLALSALFIFIMPTAAAAEQQTYDPLATTTLLPIPPSDLSEPFTTTLRNFLVPLLLPLGLLTFSFSVGAIQVADKALSKTRKSNRTRRRKLLSTLDIDEKTQGARHIVGFFHPYCNAGGGGERVLYEAVQLHLSSDPMCIVAVYTGDFPAASKEEILGKASSRFGIELDSSRILMIPLARRWMVEDTTWKRFTLLGQGYGSIWLAFEAMSSLIPDVYIDTMGYAFTFPVVRLFKRDLPVGGYVHYPVISTDMLERVRNRVGGHTNASSANSSVKTFVKLAYYRLFAWVYGWVLRRADVIVANGSWTQAHLKQLTGQPVEKVYPPCDTDEMAGFALSARTHTIVSLAQFRPEKEHPQQLHILRSLLSSHPQLANTVKLVIMGSSRNVDDEHRISLLRKLSSSLKLNGNVEFVVNADFKEILKRLETASVGVSTMKDEHFGIGVVEFMASGLVTVSHRSAGPWLDIAVPSANHPLPTEEAAAQQQEGKGVAVGYHAETVEEFVSVLAEIFKLQDKDPDHVLQMREAARERARRVFGRKAFVEAWQEKLWSRLEAKTQKTTKQSKKDQ
ncbi:GDP-Man:Man(3)GlcNAc(2)-PP-Dol alpha-1,2-mannosyltransferase [Pseudozyma hubeiensis]|nr:GDP-Man:Man(3)GlcNAc(2)-PP-Dol alpha-1,2-mannosyltransferase [Pseudozyma hubeiensis]